MTRSSQAQRLVLLGATTLLSLTAASAADISTPSTKLNVVLIIADDLGRNLGCYGDGNASTKHIDGLAQSGVRFTQAYGQGAVCTPSRNSLLSGLNTQNIGIHRTFLQQQALQVANKRQPLTQLQRLFKNHGYQTLGLGKIGHTVDYEDSAAWDRREALESDGGAVADRWSAQDSNPGGITYQTETLKFNDTTATRDVRRTTAFGNFLNERDTSKPFFAAIGFHSAHEPHCVYQRNLDAATNRTLLTQLADATPFNPLAFNFLPWSPVDETKTKVMQGYYAAVNHLDEQVGTVLKTLTDKVLDANTIVVFIGDNGYNHGFRGQWAKHDVYADVIHQPLIVRAPGVTTPGGVAGGVVEYLDIFPTLVELANPQLASGQGIGITTTAPATDRPNGGTDLAIPGATVPLKLDGRSFAAQLRSPALTATGKDAAYVEYEIPAANLRAVVANLPRSIPSLAVDIPENGGSARAVYTKEWCYVEFYGTPVRELFDLTADPHCYKNLLFDTPSAAQQGAADTLANKLHAYFPVPVNNAPVANTISATTNAGTALDLTLTGTDKGGLIKTFEAPGLTLVGGITYANGIYTQRARYTPASGFTGIFTAKVTAIDNLGKRSAPATVTITVTGTPPKENAAPVAPAVPNQTAMVGEVFTLSVPAFSDANGDALTYAASGLPAGLGFNSATRVIFGQPTTPGSATITVTATDPSRASATATFQVTVLASGVVIYGSGSVVEGVQSPWLVTHNIPLGSTTAVVSATSQDFHHNGTTSLKALLGLTNECGLASSNNIKLGFSTKSYAGVSFWINGGPNGGQQVAMAVNRLAPAGLQKKMPVTTEPLPKNTWQRVTFPLSALGAENVTDFRAFRFYNQTADGTLQAFYIDDVVLLDTAQTEFLLPKSGG